MVSPAREPHVAVLMRETLELLAPRPGACFVDGTLGAGGHAERLLEATSPSGRLFGIDRDTSALALAKTRLSRFGDRFVPIHGRHEDLGRLLESAGVSRVDGVLLDLGVSSMQLDDPDRGFSFRDDGPLDMRMDPASGVPVSEWLSQVDEVELRRVLATWGEERRAASIAREILREQRREPLRTTARLAAVVERTLGPAARRFKIHPATRTFQALRIAVNHEVEELGRTLEESVNRLVPGGRLVVLSYHSLEDRTVKRTLRALADRCTCPPRLPVCACGRRGLVRVLTARPVTPDPQEIETNPRSRSAKLRAAEAIGW